MRYPKFLQPKGRIGFIAPSFGAVIEPYNSLFKNALKRFEAAGYETVLGPNCYESCGIGKSNTPEKCGEEINDFFLNNKSDIILSCGGGETMCEDLPFVDFDGISKAEPKWYMGFSDNTNLTYTLPVLCDTAAIYGPNAPSFGKAPRYQAADDAFEVLTGKSLTVKNYELWEIEGLESEDPLEGYNMTEPFEMKIASPDGKDEAAFSGRLIGGCLDSLQNLCGTKWDQSAEFSERYAEDGIIWFFEACELTPMGVHRALWQLEQNGWFKHVKGFLFGRPMMYDAPGYGFDRYTAVTSILDKYNVPILMDLDIGHLPPAMSIISGACADVKAEGNAVEISYRFE